MIEKVCLCSFRVGVLVTRRPVTGTHIFGGKGVCEVDGESKGVMAGPDDDWTTTTRPAV